MTALTPGALPGPVWVAAPHPDDEALGCGGLIAALTDAGRDVWVLLLSDGGGSHPTSRTYPRGRLVEARLAEWWPPSRRRRPARSSCPGRGTRIPTTAQSGTRW